MQKHKHAAAIHAFADGLPIQWRRPGDLDWQDFVGYLVPTWQDDLEYRVKPEEPEYPASTISTDELRRAWIEEGNGRHLDFDSMIARACANAGLRHAFETSAAIPAAEHEAALRRINFCEEALDNYRQVVREEMAARELAIAGAVMHECERQLSKSLRFLCEFGLDLPAIIASVK